MRSLIRHRFCQPVSFSYMMEVTCPVRNHLSGQSRASKQNLFINARLIPNRMLRKNFIRTLEDFVCEHCGLEVKGTGYTNHCSKCLWSKHVDNIPGDRSNNCGGMMEPVGGESKAQEYDIVHRCLRCGITKKNKVADNDNRATILGLVAS